MNHPTIQKRLVSEHNLSFKKAFDLAQGHESAVKNIATLQGSSTTSHRHEIHRVSSQPTGNCQVCYRYGQQGDRQEYCEFKMPTCHHCGKVGYIFLVSTRIQFFTIYSTNILQYSMTAWEL